MACIWFFYFFADFYFIAGNQVWRHRESHSTDSDVRTNELLVTGELQMFSLCRWITQVGPEAELSLRSLSWLAQVYPQRPELLSPGICLHC